MASSDYAHELHIAQLAVQRAAILTQRVQATTSKGTLSKSDHSPVTIGDFGAQALIIAALRHNFHSDQIVAEEEADDLRNNESLREKVWSYVKETKLDDRESEEKLGSGLKDVDDMLNVIDLGKSKGGRSGRVWTLDPIDGTKGFLRMGQYALALALMVDGDVKVGVLGCPNLPVDDTAPLDADIGKDQTSGGEGKGVLEAAVLGQGAFSRPLTTGALAKERKISMSKVEKVTDATFCESVEAAHSNHGDQADIAKALGITRESVRMDSQAKYASIARGAGEIYLRLPVSKTYVEKIWDHAAGDLIVREAGGMVTDVNGKRIDFGTGRTLTENKGFVAAPSQLHATILSAVQKVLGAKSDWEIVEKQTL
ncbi:3(2),5-bisphosphate nucleotidase HAL2 [Microthyrium microscopicum]|uniref:3'(2'),5'-bisphosphate nucleotidase n=1 Tax=Microthyrium microscopicum TaxID=703497 RepID=A0A6A6UDT4_9PEZI|nr:3(2),5-bisphosphate nucleotidase HAL2 [Microthyrium microscopicum]